MNTNLRMGGERDRDGARTEACGMASRAILLGSNDLQSIRAAAYVLGDLCGDATGAVQLLARTVDVNPINASTWTEYSYSLASSGEFQEALAALDKAEQLDPDAVWVRYLLDPFRAIVHFYKHDWVEGIRLSQAAVNDNPGLFWIQTILANGLGLQGDHIEAREQWRLIKARFPALTVEQLLWYYQNLMPQDQAQHFVEGLLLAKVES